MGLETAPFINSLVRTNPTGGDAKSTSDDHHRVVKGALLDTFPNITGAVTVTHTQLNTVPNLATIASPTFTGVPSAPTAAVGTSTTQIATTAFAAALGMSAALPAQASSADYTITTDGTTASWSPNLKATVIRFKDGTDVTKLLAFSISGFTTATTRTMTWPDKSGTVVLTSDLPQYSYTTSIFSKTSDTALASITGLSATLVSGSVYKFTLSAYITSVNNGGTKFDFGGGTATASTFNSASINHDNAGVVNSVSSTSLTGTINDSSSVGTIQTITGTITCNGSGTFIPRFAQSLSLGTASSILVGTTLTVEKMA